MDPKIYVLILLIVSILALYRLVHPSPQGGETGSSQ